MTRGRPAIGPKVTGVRLSSQVLAEIEALAEAEGVTRAEMVRGLVGEALTGGAMKQVSKGAPRTLYVRAEDRQLWQAAEDRAKRERRSLSALVAMALEQYLDLESQG